MQSLAGKYFITGALIPAGMPGMFGRGKIIGPVNDLALHYLCEIYGIEAQELTIRNQVVYALDFLSRGDVYLYDDRELWEIESQRVHEGIKHIKKQIAAAERRQEKQQRAAMKKAGIQIIAVGDADDDDA
jgi:hypothetical protein